MAAEERARARPQPSSAPAERSPGQPRDPWGRWRGQPGGGRPRWPECPGAATSPSSPGGDAGSLPPPQPPRMLRAARTCAPQGRTRVCRQLPSAQAHVQTHACANTHVQIHVHTHTCTLTRMHAHSQAQACTRGGMRARAHSACTPTHVRTETRMHGLRRTLAILHALRGTGTSWPAPPRVPPLCRQRGPCTHTLSHTRAAVCAALDSHTRVQPRPRLLVKKYPGR